MMRQRDELSEEHEALRLLYLQVLESDVCKSEDLRGGDGHEFRKSSKRYQVDNRRLKMHMSEGVSLCLVLYHSYVANPKQCFMLCLFRIK